MKLFIRMLAFLCFTIFCLFVLENQLRSSGTFLTYPEKNGFPYVSPYTNKYPGLILPVQAPKTSYVDIRSEYTNTYSAANSDGFLTKDIQPKLANEFRIFCVGDSFTQGMGTPQGYSWPDYLARYLRDNAPNKQISIYNYGAAGSDPAYEFYLINQKILNYQPNLIIALINHTDIEDFILRGGLNRYLYAGLIKTTKGPWWEPYYAKSHLVRFLAAFCGYDMFLHSKRARIAKATTAAFQIKESLNYIAFKAQRLHCQTLFVLQDNIVAARLKKQGLTGLNVFDISSDLPEEYAKLLNNQKKYFWEIDGHCKKPGYEFYGNHIGAHILGQKLLEQSPPGNASPQIIINSAFPASINKNNLSELNCQFITQQKNTFVKILLPTPIKCKELTITFSIPVKQVKIAYAGVNHKNQQVFYEPQQMLIQQITPETYTAKLKAQQFGDLVEGIQITFVSKLNTKINLNLAVN